MNRNLKILIIDDNQADAKLLLRFLEKIPDWSFQIELAFDFDDAQKKIEEQLPHIAFIDYLLDKRNGIELIEYFIHQGYKSKFILLTGYGSEDIVAQALRIGASDYLNKNLLNLEMIEKAIRHSWEKIMADKKLLATEYKLQTIIERTDTGMVHLNEKGIILDANLPFIRMIGENKIEDVVNKTILTWIPINCKPKIFEFISICLKQNQLFDYEIQFTQNNGKIIYIILNAFVEKNNDNTDIIAIVRDITERILYENQLKMAIRKAEEADQLKSSFLSNLSHEIRTPLNAIVGFSNLLTEKETSDAEKFEYINYIKSNSDNLLKIIDDIIDISTIVAGQIKITKEKINITEIFNEYEDIVSKKLIECDKQKIKFSVDIPQKFDNFHIITDGVRLRQIINCLIDNAMKFTKEGKIVLSFSYDEYKNYIEISVSDSGIGISKDYQGKIFEKFYKVSFGKDEFFTGSGLGLAIAKNLTEILGGYINVTSELGKGSVFSIKLPYNFENAGFVQASGYIEKERNYNWKDKKFLLVEDEHTNYLFIKVALQKTGVNVIWAKSGKEALEKINQDTVYDVVLMDIKLPDISGYDVTKAIRETNSDIPIIAQTAFALSNEKDLILRSGFNDYISKPINIRTLYRTISKWL